MNPKNLNRPATNLEQAEHYGYIHGFQCLRFFPPSEWIYKIKGVDGVYTQAYIEGKKKSNNDQWRTYKYAEIETAADEYYKELTNG